MVDTKLLPKVEDRFVIVGRGVVLVPSFSVPTGWQNCEERIFVTTPDDQRYTTTARFTLTHFNISDPQASADRHWQIVLMLPEVEKDEIPVGSSVFVASHLCDLFHISAQDS